ncbi:hypothetical protein BH20CHL1_BH20CHL1_00560 [soil metagenome]
MTTTQHTITAPSDTNGVPGRAIVPVLALATMIGMTNQFSLAAFLPVISTELSVSVPLLGQIATLIFFGAAGIGLLAGPLADGYGKRRVLVVGLAVVFISATGTMLAPSYGWLLATRMISAVSAGLMSGTTLAIAAALFTGNARRRAMGSIVGGMAASAIVGVPALTLVAALSSWRVSYGALGALALVLIPLVYRLLPDDSVHTAGGIDLREILDAYRPLLAQRSMLRLYGSTVARAIGWFGTLAYVGAYLGDEHGLSTGEIGWAYLVGGTGYFLGTRLTDTRWMIDIGPRKLYGLMTSLMGLLVGLSVILPAGPVASIAVLTIGAAASGIGFVVFVILLSTETTAGQATTMSLNAAMLALGGALGGLFGGLFLAVGGYALLGLGLMGFSFAGAALVWRPGVLEIPVPETTGTAT